MIQTKKRTHEEYIAELAIKNPTIEVVGKYIAANTKVLHHCCTHDIYWETTPSRVLQGNGCEMCRKEKFRQTRCKSMVRYVDEVHQRNPHIIIMEPYIDAKTPILHKCTIHDVKWKSSPDSILHGHGCPKCGAEKIGLKNSKSHEQYVQELKSINPNIIVLDDYIDAITPVLHQCLIDGYEWYARPGNILFGRGCPKCAGNMKKQHDEYVKELSIVNPNIEVIETYIAARIPILHRCKIDGHIWSTSPTSTLHGYGCPRCSESKGEKAICKWLNRHNIAYLQQKRFKECKDKRELPFDFYLPDYNAAIEYNGQQHYKAVEHFGGEEAFKLRIKHDKIKEKYCKDMNINFLCIPYYKNIEKELNNFLFI